MIIIGCIILNNSSHNVYDVICYKYNSEILLLLDVLYINNSSHNVYDVICYKYNSEI